MSSDARAPREWKVIKGLGQVFSGWDESNYYLWVAEDGVVAVPTRNWPTLLLVGLGAATGNLGMTQAAYEQQPATEGPLVLVDEGAFEWRRYPAAHLEKVFVKRCLFGYNELHLKLVGQDSHVYGLPARGQTKACRVTFRGLFPDVYSDKGFKAPPEES